MNTATIENNAAGLELMAALFAHHEVITAMSLLGSRAIVIFYI